MQVTVVSTLTSAAWGGSEVLWSMTADRLLREGHAVHAVTHRRRSGPVPPVLDSLAHAGLHRSTWRHAGRPRRILTKAGLAGGPLHGGQVLLANLASAHDLVTAVIPRAMVRRAREAAVPYVLAPHSVVERRIPPRNRELLREVYGSAAAIVVPSPSVAEDIERQLAAHLPRWVEIPTSTPLLDAPPLPWPEPGPLRLALVARVDVEQKGHDVLIAALAATSWRYANWSLDVYGDGPDLGYVGQLVDHYGLTDRVRLAGHADDVTAVWRDHEALVLPSRRESRGIAIAEAMACGRPVLGTAVGGIPKSVLDGRTGLLAAAPTVGALTVALEHLWALRAELPAMGRRARAHTEALYKQEPAAALAALLLEVGERG